MRLSSAFVCTALAAVATAQSAAPAQNNTNGVIIPSVSQINGASTLIFLKSVNKFYLVYPLTPGAFKQVPHASDSSSGIDGNLVLNNDQTLDGQLKPGDFAFTNCNSSAYPGPIGVTQVVQHAIRANVTAIIFYSQFSTYCNLTDPSAYGNYTSLFTMQLQNETNALVKYMQHASFREADTEAIFTYDAFQRYVNTESSFSEFGGAGSTAVAMIILYSITGVITALFLIIIVTGAIRAHRHPERYGPRNVLGRPRQSRAKGIARAMLDTIPIVKFGEKEAEADANKEAERAENGSSIAMDSRSPQPLGATDEAQASTGVSETEPGALNSITTAGTTKSQSDPVEDRTDEALGCSICTDDFERGQDIRVLPCNHKFHPACVDPWLLEVSGTCPLCRVDLHPPTTAEGEDTTSSDELPPPLDPTAATEGTGIAGAPFRRRDTLRSFIGPRMNRRGMQGASGEERLEMLRRWREASRAQSTGNTATTSATQTDAERQAATEEESRRENRLSRFSRIMRRRER